PWRFVRSPSAIRTARTRRCRCGATRRSWMPPRNTAWHRHDAKAGYVAPAWPPARAATRWTHRGTVRCRAGGAKDPHCQTFVTSRCRIELQYPVDDNAALLVTGDGVVTAVELVSPSTAILRVDTSGMAGALRYRAGQFAQLQVPGTNVWRNYSYAHPADGRGECEFIIRLLPDGVMSNYLRDRAQPGDHIALRCSKGSFYLRPIVRPVILVAGGTGLSAILAMAQSLDADVAHPVYLLYGVERTEDLCKLDELTELRRRVGRLEVHVVVARPDPDWDGRTGLVTDLLDERMLASGDADVLSVRSGRHGRRSPNLAGPQWLSPCRGCTTRSSWPAGRRAAAPRLGWITRAWTLPRCAAAAAAPRWSSAAASRASRRRKCSARPSIASSCWRRTARTVAARAGRARHRVGTCTTC
ncbi:LOW QUALITY PROTEIN: oxygenase, partial [Mycobacterium tuberculosis T85]